MLRRDVPALVYRPVSQVNQIQRRGEDKVLHPGQLAAVALQHAHQLMHPGVVRIDALGEKRIDAHRIKRQRRRSRQTVRTGAVDAGGGPHHARKLFERQRCGRIFAPRAAVGQRLVHTRPAHGVGCHEGDFRAVFHFGLRRRGLSGRRTSAARRHQQRRAGNQFRFHLSQNLVVSPRIYEKIPIRTRFSGTNPLPDIQSKSASAAEPSTATISSP